MDWIQTPNPKWFGGGELPTLLLPQPGGNLWSEASEAASTVPLRGEVGLTDFCQVLVWLEQSRSTWTSTCIITYVCIYKPEKESRTSERTTVMRHGLRYGIKNGRAYKRRAMFALAFYGKFACSSNNWKKTHKECTLENKKTTSWNRSTLVNHQMIQYDGKHEPPLQHQPCS